MRLTPRVAILRSCSLICSASRSRMRRSRRNVSGISADPSVCGVADSASGLRPRARSAALLVTIPEATAKSISTSNAFGCSGVGESNAHATAGIEHARYQRLHAEVLVALRRRNREMYVQRIAGTRLRTGGYQRTRATGTDKQHAALAEVANRAQPRPPFLRVYECTDRYGLSRVSTPVHVLSSPASTR